jgi:hypothetical protein
MKIFIKTGVAPDSINFVDEENRVIGWNAEQICCENHSARLTATMPTLEGNSVKITNAVLDFNALENTTMDLPSFRIDPEFCKRMHGTVVFRLVNEQEDTDELFVVLENYHNGYYSHGFSLSIEGEKKFSGLL